MSELSDEEISKQVAALCGWTDLSIESAGDVVSFAYGRPPNSETYDTAPDYANDLNAAWQMEEELMKQVDGEGWAQYIGELERLCGSITPRPAHVKTVWEHFALVIHAKARQRALAFLRVKETK